MQLSKVYFLVFACGAAAIAQDKVTVPLSSPTQPPTVKVHLISGSITVTGGGPASEVSVQSGKSSTEKRPPRDLPAGMHRLDSGEPGLDIEEDHNVVTIGAGRYESGASVTVQVPANASLQLSTISGGHLDVTGVNGDIEVSNMNGSITLTGVSGSVVASTQNGHITVGLDKVTPDKPMSFTSLNGKVDVTLPADTKARLRLKTGNGAIYSDFDVKTEPDATKPVVEDARGQGGRYRIRVDRSVYGSINGGGPEYRFETVNGNILIHKK